MTKMTKNEFRKFAKLRGVIATYCGKQKKFFLRKVSKMDINNVINQKQ